MRVPHIIKSNKQLSRPTRIILFDTETTAIPIAEGQEKHVLRLGVACYWHRRGENEKDTFDWLTFHSSDQLWDWVVERNYPKTTLVLSSHNLSFDLPILDTFTKLPEKDYTLTSYYCKGRTTLARFRYKNRKLDLVDNTNFFSASLASLAPLVGLEKLEIDFETASEDQLKRYCHRDVEILLHLWQKWFAFVEKHNLGKWRRTLSSQAFTAFQHRFMGNKIVIHDHAKACKLERSAYHGGRVEVLRVGSYTNGPYYKLDVNSMYPYVMRNNSYPTRLFRYQSKSSVSSLKRKLKLYHVVADCMIDTPEPAFPTLVNNHIAYPTGTFRTSLTTPELQYLLTIGKILEVYSLAYYDSAYIFVKYVDYFYPLKQEYHEENNHAFREIVKGFLNYLYGKFGQRGLSDSIVGVCSPDVMKIVEVYDIETHQYYDLIYLAGQIIKREKQEESYNSFPAIAAEVTANARLYLHSLVKRAGRGHVYYVDTDSLIVDAQGYDSLASLIHPTKLGALKLEGLTQTIELRAPKDYTFGGKDRIKGIRNNALRLAPNVYQQDKFPSIQGLLRKENLTDYIVTQTVKHLSREIYSGNIALDGTIIPFSLPLVSPEPSLPPQPPS